MATNSPATTTLRAVVMLSCLIAIPTLAVSGKSLPDALKALAETGHRQAASIFGPSPAVAAPQGACPMSEAPIAGPRGGFIGPQRATASLDLQPVDRAALDLVFDAPFAEPDASDAMPPEIGSGLLWREITDWVADAVSYEQFAATVDEAVAAAP